MTLRPFPEFPDIELRFPLLEPNALTTLEIRWNIREARWDVVELPKPSA